MVDIRRICARADVGEQGCEGRDRALIERGDHVRQRIAIGDCSERSGHAI